MSAGNSATSATPLLLSGPQPVLNNEKWLVAPVASLTFIEVTNAVQPFAPGEKLLTASTPSYNERRTKTKLKTRCA